MKKKINKIKQIYTSFFTRVTRTIKLLLLLTDSRSMDQEGDRSWEKIRSILANVLNHFITFRQNENESFKTKAQFAWNLNSCWALLQRPDSNQRKYLIINALFRKSSSWV